MPVRYEWDIETVDVESEDILDHDHRDKLSEFGAEELLHAINQDLEPGNNFTRLVLVRDHFDKTGDLICRSWAYVDDQELPTEFRDAYDRPVVAVPKRFHQEFKL